MATYYSLDFGNLDPSVFSVLKNKEITTTGASWPTCRGELPPPPPPLKERSKTYKLSHRDGFAFEVFKPGDVVKVFQYLN